jgi:hypothetical protein
MAETVKRVEYFYATVEDRPGEGRRLLEHLSEKGVNLLAFTAFPIGAGKSQLDFVPENAALLRRAATDAGLSLAGPKRAFLIQGEDRIGALHEHHLRLSNAGINVYAANGVVDGSGRFGYILWVKPEDYEKTAQTLGA